MNYYTSDTHFGHANVLEYDERPYSNLLDMTEDMIQKWNSVVTPDDTVYHLGDVAMSSGGRGRYVGLVRNIFERLNGYKILVRGNHDDKPQVMLDCGFDEVHSTMHVDDGDYRLYLIHNPWSFIERAAESVARVALAAGLSGRHVPEGHENIWPVIQDNTASIILHGHLHTKGWASRFNDAGQRLINVGCMRWDYTPQTLLNLLTKQKENSI